MPSTYETISSTTLTSTQSTITLSSIPATYTDLKLVIVNIMSGNGGNGLLIRFNSDSGTNYSYNELGAYGATIATRANNETAAKIAILGTSTVSSPIASTIDIFSYTGNTYKAMLSATSGAQNGSSSVECAVNLWRSTSAINTITITQADGQSFIATTRATLYGIKAA